MRKVLAGVFAALAIVVAAGAVYVCGYAGRNKPYVPDEPEVIGSPSESLQGFFGSLEDRNWADAYSYLSNYSTLGLEARPEDSVAALFWQAQQDVWDFDVVEDYDMSGSLLTKQVRVKYLDMNAMSDRIGARVQDGLAQAVEEARLSSEIYDVNGDYREELVLSHLERATGEVLLDLSDYEYSRTVSVKLALEDSVWRIVADSELIGALTSGAVTSVTTVRQGEGVKPTAAIVPAFEMYVNNLTSSAMDGLLPIPKSYWLAEDVTIAPEPNQELFGSSYDPADTADILAAAARLLDGQDTIWSTDKTLMPNTPVRWYLDDTIFDITWKEVVNNCVYTLSEVKIAHPSQFRRYFVNDTFNYSVQYTPSELAATVNAVAAMNGDFYKFRPTGTVVYRRTLYRTDLYSLDNCFVDTNGDLNFVRRGTFGSSEEIEEYIKENDILFSLSFGPILIENGEIALPGSYLVGEINDHYSRAVICQLGECHYLMVTANGEGAYSHSTTLQELGNELYKMGVRKAYTLDGGQTATLIMNDEVINHVDWSSERAVSDIIYFATAIPDAPVTGDAGEN